jgi:organic radical activating enzyme
MRSYRVKNIFGPTIQGEGPHQGRPCVFIRLAGCNAWDGRPETRANSACPYCDTDFFGGETLDLSVILARLISRLSAVQAKTHEGNFGCVLSGGEPLLQADTALIDALGKAFTWVDIETNGTKPCPPRPDNVFISCSPKHIEGSPIVVDPDWWKVLIPDQEGFLDQALASGKAVYVQPTCPDAGPQGSAYEQALARCLELCYTRGCRLSIQLHKVIGVE